ncbi:unnamed protein product [Ambrosiozyma monospora]|uniref:Unnamed protein product n=1 Tax=Ambrosiozyma monospora TaxID=43982 RepID=A0A9W7DGU5_AMBMO|nr:unnamed protein product [Ambrosiozyma monospora]
MYIGFNVSNGKHHAPITLPFVTYHLFLVKINHFLKWESVCHRLYNFCACHHYGTIDVGPTADRYGNVVPTPETGARYGLSDDKIWKPGEKYIRSYSCLRSHQLCWIQHVNTSPLNIYVCLLLSVLMLKVSKVMQAESRLMRILVMITYVAYVVKTNVLSAYGQSISYSINVRMIGRHLDFHKQFYTKTTDRDLDFIFTQDIQHFFRVSTAGETKLINHDFL